MKRSTGTMFGQSLSGGATKGSTRHFSFERSAIHGSYAGTTPPTPAALSIASKRAKASALAGASLLHRRNSASVATELGASTHPAASTASNTTHRDHRRSRIESPVPAAPRAARATSGNDASA